MRESYKNYGLWLFRKIEEGIEGLIHSSELDWTIEILSLVKFFLFHKKLNLKLSTLTKKQKEFHCLIKQH